MPYKVSFNFLAGSCGHTAFAFKYDPLGRFEKKDKLISKQNMFMGKMNKSKFIFF